MDGEGTEGIVALKPEASRPAGSRIPSRDGQSSSRKLGDLLKRLRDSTNFAGGGSGNDEEDEEEDFWTLPPATPSPHHRLLALSRGGSPAAGEGLLGRPPPFVLSFSELTYSVKLRRRTFPFAGSKEQETKLLLDSVSGEAREGEILAVLGASGSGKSTLIDALAGRISRGSLRGTWRSTASLSTGAAASESHLRLRDAGRSASPDAHRRGGAHFRGGVPPPPVHAHGQEAPEGAGPDRPTGPPRRRRHHHRQRAPPRGLRGGAAEGLHRGRHRPRPHRPLLDEPTSGLDSSSAFQVVQVLQGIARSGSVVVMSVHQPSSRILSLLDRLLFLSRGRALYSGPPAGLPEFFAGFGHPVPEKESRTEFTLDLILELEISPGGTDALAEYYSRWRAAHPMFTLRDAISASVSRGKLVSGAAAVAGERRGEKKRGNQRGSGVPAFANPFWVEVQVLTRRSFTNARRQPELVAVWLGALLVTGLMLAAVFWKRDLSALGVQERLGFALAVTTTYFTCGEVLPEFLQERYIFIRETAHNAYRRSSYVLASTVASVPSLLPLSLTLATVTFFAVGLHGGASGFLFYLLVIFACFWTGISYMTFLSGVITDERLAFTADRLPRFWLWLHYLSLVKYPYEAVMHNEFDDPRRCFVTGEQIFDRTALAGTSLELKVRLLQALGSALGVNITAGTCIVNGPYVLRLQGITDLAKWTCVWILLAMGVLYRALFYLALLFGSRNKRR
ncbi:unnamed protein product [Spirodela intermedia]|uniref:ABC transporter domain-containing protein n=1 Tax=Spirodela intermedia TaxID=51605 RepID=A0A7I8ITI9_SPIIN|nr:unnamed protein product [Spirodela intermedia]CAA6661332.1 unnamed protein product [Spirodela intermedia]